MVTIDEKIAQYREKEKNATFYLMLLCLIIAVVFFLSITASEIKISVLEGIQIIIDRINGVQPEGFLPTLKDRIVIDQNIPRGIGAIAAGIVLSISGAVLQNLIRNPLADPYTLGISSGALFGMVIYIAYGVSIVPFIIGDDAEIFNAFVAALAPTAVVIFMAMFKKVTPTMMILCGIAVMYIFNAVTVIIKYTIEPEKLSAIYQWSIGSVSGLAWGSLPKLMLAIVIVLIPMMYIREKIDIVAQGDNQAITLGVNPNKLRICSLIVVSVATAIIVCYTGTIGFVGLVAPHIARIFVGSKCKSLIPFSAAVGALMVLGCDYIVRVIAPTLPVGVILALVCSPIFIIILIRMRREVW